MNTVLQIGCPRCSGSGLHIEEMLNGDGLPVTNWSECTLCEGTKKVAPESAAAYILENLGKPPPEDVQDSHAMEDDHVECWPSWEEIEFDDYADWNGPQD